MSGFGPPPPVPHRALTYEPSNRPLLPQAFLNTGSSLGSQPAVSLAAGAVGAEVNNIPPAMSHHDYPLPTTLSAGGQQYWHAPTSVNRHPPWLSTKWFKDHLGRLALLVLVPGQIPSLSNLSNPSSAPRSSSSTRSSSPISNKPSSGTTAAQDATAKHTPLYITIQLYLHNDSPVFADQNETENVKNWCRQLQTSTAFQHLRMRLSEQSTASTPPPSIVIEAYEAVRSSQVINHSLNEREFRNLQKCYHYIDRFIDYTRKRRAEPGFVMPEHIAVKGMKFLENRKFIMEQMEDIRRGDGGKNRRRRAALRAQLGPAFEDRRGPGMNTQQQLFPNSSLDLSHLFTMPAQPNQQPTGPGPFNALLLATQQGAHRPDPSSSSRMPPPPTPSQGYQGPAEGSMANPHRLAPCSLSTNSIYRGISQPYHNILLAIDSPNWAGDAGISVIKFGYEPDWASGQSIKRPGATHEKASLAQGAGKRWLGDVLVEAFVGDGTEGEGVPAWMRDPDAVVGPHGDRSTDEELGVGAGSGVDERTAQLLKNVSVLGAENVDFLERPGLFV